MRVRRSLLNFGTSALFLVVTMLVSLKATPLLVAWLGTRKYGGARVVADGHGYLTLLELGLGGAVGPVLARAFGQGDHSAARRTVAAGMRAYGRVSLFTVAAGLMLTPVIPRFASDMNREELLDLRLAWVIGLSAFLSLALLPTRALFEASQRGYVVNLALTAQAVLITVLSLLLARAGWGMTGQALASATGAWISGLGLALGAAWSHPALFRSIWTEHVPRDDATRRALRELSGPTLAINVCGRFGLLADNLIVGGMLGVSRVTSLVNTQRLVQVGQGVLQAVGSASWAALAELHVQGRQAVFNHRLIEMSRLVALLGASGLAPVVAFNRAFVRVWLGPEFVYGGDLVAYTSAFNALILAEQSLWGWCFAATGKARVLVGPAVASAMLNLAASVVLAKYVGIAGPLMGTALGLSAVGLWALPMLLRREFGTPLSSLAIAVLAPLAWGVAGLLVLRMVDRAFEPSGWPGLILAEGLSGLALLAAGGCLLLPRDERAIWKGRVRDLIAWRPGSDT